MMQIALLIAGFGDALSQRSKSLLNCALDQILSLHPCDKPRRRAVFKSHQFKQKPAEMTPRALC